MLYIVGTPIGNLEDITFRAIRILGEVDFILAEDTRVTQKLLNHYQIKTKTIALHEHSDLNRFEKIMALILEGKNLALVTDAGTPGISDPGSRLINYLRSEIEVDLKISPIPGPSALISAISIFGIKGSEFSFLGFPPHKKGRKTFFEKIAKAKTPVIFYESTHRIIKALENLDLVCPDRIVKVAKELTKIHENYFEGKPSDIIKLLTEDKALIKGEFVILLE